MRLVLLLAVLMAAVSLAAVGLSRAAALGEPLPPGWAPGGKATDPSSQIKHDTICGPNSVLLFSARGSGDKYGANFVHNRIGQWTQVAGHVLGKRGWSVRDLQAIYPAPPVPSFAKIAAAALVGGALQGGSGAAKAVALIVKDYRDAASKSWPSVKRELVAAYHRCPTRPILLAGYSQGAILLRYVVPRLPTKVLQKVRSVDLIADPTEQAAVDSGLQHPANLDGLLTTDGIDTWAGAAVHLGTGFRQRAYPPSLRNRTYQYCIANDLVCNFTAGNLAPENVAVEGKTHASYVFGKIGVVAAKRLGGYGLAAFTGTWGRHTAQLTISRSGRAREAIGDGCCDPIIDLTFRLSHARGTSEAATATIRVTQVKVHRKSAFDRKHAAPHVGQVAKLRLRNGILTEPLTYTFYCDKQKDLSGVCGA